MSMSCSLCVNAEQNDSDEGFCRGKGQWNDLNPVEEVAEIMNMIGDPHSTYSTLSLLTCLYIFSGRVTVLTVSQLKYLLSQ